MQIEELNKLQDRIKENGTKESITLRNFKKSNIGNERTHNNK